MKGDTVTWGAGWVMLEVFWEGMGECKETYCGGNIAEGGSKKEEGGVHCERLDG